MIKPKSLKQGATIGIIAPASPCESIEIVDTYSKKLKDCGYKLIIGESCYGKYGYLAGNDLLRAKDLMNMFKNPNVNAIFCLRGGYGCARMVDYLDYKVIKENPKIFVGFSDITVLHSAINKLCNLITFHGPSVSNCEWNTNDFRYMNCMKVLTGNTSTLKSEFDYNYLPCEGILCGGNLTLVESLIGTKYEIDPTNKILILEDVGEKNYSTDRRLTHLRQAGYFQKCRAVVCGRFTESDNEITEDNLSLCQIIEDVIVPSKKPILCGVNFGHIKLNPTIPLGAQSSIDHYSLNIEVSVSN